MCVCQRVSPAPAVLYGEVQSPLYPQPYPAGVYKEWNLTVPAGFGIEFTFTHLDIQPSQNCSTDSLTIIFDDKVLGFFCGRSLGYYAILSPGNYLHVVFKTSATNKTSHQGFRGFYKAVGDVCGDPKPLLNGGVKFLSITKKHYLSVIEYSCNEPYYTFQGTDKVRFSCSEDGTWRDQKNRDTPPKCIPVCGRPVVSLESRQRVLQGEVARAGEFPWQVLLLVGGRGGASVIAPDWIMTAAHNLESMSVDQIKVYVGHSDVHEMIKSTPLEVASIHIHPQYNNHQGKSNFDNDIALIKLKRPITFNADVMPLCLPPSNAQYPTGKIGTVSGFGITEGSMIANELRYVRLPLVDQQKCRASIDAKRSEFSDISIFTGNMFCAGFPEGSKDTCQGDSGGAYVLKDGERYWAAGIVSWVLGCGEAGTYGVYTRVAQYLDWITKTMEETLEECEEPTLSYALAVEGRLSTHYKSQINFTCNSKYYKLDSDEVFTCEADGLWRSQSGQTEFPKCHPICGVRESQISGGRILGRQRAKLGEIPWQLLIKQPRRGGASLINDRWAVTAAHVVDGHEDKTLTFYGGMVDGMDRKAVVMLTEKIIIHPSYEKGTPDSRRTNYDNDIALLKMSSRVKLGPNLMPICLPEKAEGAALEGKMGTVSGYGMMETKEKARMLKYANIQEYETEKCDDTPKIEEGTSVIFTKNMFCAGLEGVDGCGGDGGGPLFLPMIGWGKADDPYRLKGIVSWGAYCCENIYKGYYTNVQNYLGWIKETIEKEDDD